MLDERSGLEQVAAARLRDVILPAHDVLPQTQVGRALRPETRHAADVDRAHAVAARHEHRQRLARVGLHVLADARAAVADARGVHGLAERLAVLAGQELIGGNEGPGKLGKVGGQPLIGVVERVADEELRAARPHGVDPGLEEVLIQPLIERKRVACQSAAEVLAVGDGKLVEVRPHERVDGDRSSRQQAQPRVVVRHGGHDRAAKVLAQRFIADEIEEPVAPNRPAQRRPELVAREVRLLPDVEVIARVECVVAVELEDAAVEPVGPGSRDDIDLAADIAPEFRAVGVRLDPEFLHRLHAERRAGRAPGRAVREVVEQRAVEQVDVRARILPVDAHGQPVRDDRSVVPIGKGRHRGLEGHQVRVVAPVDRDLLDRPAVDEVTELRTSGIHERLGSRDGHRLGRADLQRQGQRRLFGHTEPNAGTDDGPKSGELGAESVVAGRQPGERESALHVGRGRSSQPGLRLGRGHQDAREPRPSRVDRLAHNRRRRLGPAYSWPQHRQQKAHDNAPTKHHGHSSVLSRCLLRTVSASPGRRPDSGICRNPSTPREKQGPGPCSISSREEWLG